MKTSKDTSNKAIKQIPERKFQIKINTESECKCHSIYCSRGKHQNTIDWLR